MARNKPSKPLTEAPPEPESSSEQVSGSSTEPDNDPEVSSSSSEEEDDEQKTPPPAPAPAPVVTPKKTTHQPDSDDESGSGSGSDSDEDENDTPVAKLKPVSKPVVDSKPRSKPVEKRPIEGLKENPSSKKPKKDAKPGIVSPGLGSGPGPGLSPGPGEEVKKLFQRVFSEEDEVEILKGLIEFKERNGGDPMKNDDEFYGFIKKKLHVEVNKGQTMDKVKRLKRKFVNAKKNSKKKNVSGHEKKLFELSNKIWEVEDEGDVKVNGGGNASGGVVTVAYLKENDSVKSGLKDKSLKVDNGVVEGKKKTKEEENEGDEIDEGFRVGEGEVKEVIRAEALKKMGEKGRVEIKEMWRKVEVAQLEVDLMRAEARVKESRMIMEALGLGKR